jgi:hypothetical protein
MRGTGTYPLKGGCLEHAHEPLPYMSLFDGTSKHPPPVLAQPLLYAVQ